MTNEETNIGVLFFSFINFTIKYAMIIDKLKEVIYKNLSAIRFIVGMIFITGRRETAKNKRQKDTTLWRL